MKQIMKFPLLCCIAVAFLSGSVFASDFVFFDKELLEKGREQFHSAPTANMKGAYAHLMEEAEDAYTAGPFSVLDKSSTPPSGDKHDYMSLHPYWWPDTTKEDGLPWIFKDGRTNPMTKTKAFDPKTLGRMTRSVRALALGYYFSGDEKYAQKAIEYLRIWFLNPETKMNPNMKYAHGVPGRDDLRSTGILDSRSFSDRLLDSLVILESSKNWTAEDQKGMKAWYTDYLDWLLNSENGKGAMAAENFDGSWYDVQVAGIAYYLGQTDKVKEVAERAKGRIDTQIKANGEQPIELARTKGWWFSFFNLDALSHVAQVADKVGVDLWSYKGKQGGSLLSGTQLIAKYHFNPDDWPYAKKGTPRVMRAMPLYRKVALATGDQALMKLSQDGGDWSQFSVKKKLGETWAERDVELIYRPAK